MVPRYTACLSTCEQAWCLTLTHAKEYSFEYRVSLKITAIKDCNCLWIKVISITVGSYEGT